VLVPFRDEQIEQLAGSGWVQCGSIVQAVADAGLPAPTAAYLRRTFPARQWATAERATAALRSHFAQARFAHEAVYGVLLVPDPAKLDTRQPMRPGVRADQLGRPTGDVFDERLPPGTLGVEPGQDWTLVATVTGLYGISCGSHNSVAGASAEAFTVDGHETRALMIRQVWGARVLQCGADLPDCEANDHWTFTLFPGEPLTDGAAESGTVLKGKVRFRLVKPHRAIGSARVAPAIVIP
jgi:hypothetical protein